MYTNDPFIPARNAKQSALLNKEHSHKQCIVLKISRVAGVTDRRVTRQAADGAQLASQTNTSSFARPILTKDFPVMIFGCELTAKKKEGLYSYFFPTTDCGSFLCHLWLDHISLSRVLKLATAKLSLTHVISVKTRSPVHHKRLRMRESFSARHFNEC